jgi:hypothetical protein
MQPKLLVLGFYLISSVLRLLSPKGDAHGSSHYRRLRTLRRLPSSIRQGET